MTYFLYAAHSMHFIMIPFQAFLYLAIVFRVSWTHREKKSFGDLRALALNNSLLWKARSLRWAGLTFGMGPTFVSALCAFALANFRRLGLHLMKWLDDTPFSYILDGAIRGLGSGFELCYSESSIRGSVSASECLPSGRSAAWLARLVRDQEAGGSNPLAPTIFFNRLESRFVVPLASVHVI